MSLQNILDGVSFPYKTEKAKFSNDYSSFDLHDAWLKYESTNLRKSKIRLGKLSEDTSNVMLILLNDNVQNIEDRDLDSYVFLQAYGDDEEDKKEVIDFVNSYFSN